ncbi:amino acid ABC transporter substrate-binding protein [Streptococcus cuniculipharyngis]|uniref:Amino acid ABC transporter substrate-binding protein n=1 Tax=Streptococcus cuniculipharyngis TaxID=1562651 RepID=A0A5C5SGE7_9STRE|nr:amino acid ABC transporter substrate-binding protein [Streptococcus cuniculipharyngis]TWS99213.1 amino acid ABC transporter substrate-binding protein [Streptococcus cuniculipharyngis]
MKKLLTLVTLCLSLFLVACQSKDSNASKTSDSDQWARYEKEKTITIGFDNTFVPMGFEDEAGKTVGFDIDLANAVFDRYGIKVKWQAINWDLKETELNSGKIDLIWNGYSMTPEREKKVLFTNPYMKNEQVLVSKKSSSIKRFAEMKDKVLGVQAGSSGYDAFLANPTVLKDLVKNQDATQYSTFTEALIDLKNNRIDGLLIDRVYANYYLQKEGELDQYNIVQSEYSGENFAVGARKADTTLVEKINQAFKELYQEGKFQEISDKWFGEDIATDQVKN